MTFYDSVSFDINVNGEKAAVKKFADFILSGGLDDFFEVDKDFLSFDDDFDEAPPTETVSMLFTTDEFGVEVEEFDSDEFLEILCKAGKALYINGSIYNFDDDEFRFVSYANDQYYINANNITDFNDELDEEASRENADDDEE